MNVKARVEFDKHLRDWDGFGVNYVEASQTRNYDENPQDYGGFSTLSEEKRGEIVDLIFGDKGLKPGLVKMFLDPFHQEKPTDDSYAIHDTDFDHEKTTRWMRYFVEQGLQTTRGRGDDLQIMTGLYSLPAFMTKQKVLRGREFDPDFKIQAAKYIASFGRYLKQKNNWPVTAVSLHNEGEDWWRWPEDGGDPESYSKHDYNMHWTPEMVSEMIPVVRKVLDENGCADIHVTPGETSFWNRFNTWGYADAIADNPEAVEALGLITSHGFQPPGHWNSTRYYGDWGSAGIDILREQKPDLHAWVTSTSFADMTATFIWQFYMNMYSAKVNGIIPWALIQTGSWVGGDPNPGCAFFLDQKGNYEVRDGYYYFKPLCRAGQPGMKVARTRSSETFLGVMAFASNNTKNKDAFVVVNRPDENKNFSNFDMVTDVEVRGTGTKTWYVYRTDGEKKYHFVEELEVENGKFTYLFPENSVTAFFTEKQD